MNKIKAILCDIEGTTTSITFVHDILFPYSLENLEEYINSIWDSVSFADDLKILKKKIVNEQSKNFDSIKQIDIANLLKEYIKNDIKDRILKKIQGQIWRVAYESKKIKGHLFKDVPDNFNKWIQGNIKIFIFSSGSTEAQKLLFKYSEYGDLTEYISDYFDTQIGNKKDKASYEKICESVKINSKNILFLSDVVDELEAADAAGMKVILSERPENYFQKEHRFKIIKSFNEINI